MKLIIILFAVLCFASCKNEEKTSETTSVENTKENRNATSVDTHNSQNSLDWVGVYEGVLPCESCDGVETNIQIDENMDYELSQNYLGGEQENNINETGKFEWNEQGNTISLGDRRKLYFKVSENYLLQVFKDESKVMGDSAMQYRLTKINDL